MTRENPLGGRSFLHNFPFKEGVRFDVRGISFIDFNQIENYRAPNDACACVYVATSNGRIGTMTELDISVDPQKFADDLKSLIGIDVNIGLIGGSNFHERGPLFAEQLYRSLREKKFKINPQKCLIGGSAARLPILYPNKVLVEERDFNISFGEEQKIAVKEILF